MLRAIGIVLVAGAMLLAVMPVHAAQFVVAADGPLVVWVASDGKVTVGHPDPVTSDAQRTQVCRGTAPVTNACTLQDTTTFPYGGGWSVGFLFPAGELAPAGAFVGSTVVNFSGTQHVDLDTWELVDGPYSFEVGCNWYMVNVFGFLAGDWNCGDLGPPRTALPAGDLTAAFHAGALDGRLPVYHFGLSNDQELGVGNWGGVLEAS
jgi:hypothetical protein